KIRVSYPLLLDPNLQLVRAYGVENSAYVVLVDQKGQIMMDWPGYSASMLQASSTPGALMTCKPRCPNARKEQALRLMAIRQARLEPLALSASSHERIVNGCLRWTA